MNFQIEESEFNALESVTAQLNLVAGLMVCASASRSDFNALVNPQDIHAYLATQVESLERVTTSITARYEAQRAALAAIAPHHFPTKG